MHDKKKQPRTKRTIRRQKKTAYLSKRVLVRAVTKATRHKAARAMELMGYVMEVENGWVVKVDANGNRTRISPLDTDPIPSKIVVD